MYLQYFKIRFLPIGRLLCLLGLRTPIVLLLLLLPLLGYATAVQPYYSPIALVLTLYAFHTCRRDKHFLQRFFENNTLRLYWLEYALVAVPFAILSWCKLFWVDLLLYAPIVLLAPLLFRFKIKTLRFSHPLLRKGGYEYQTAFRSNYGGLFAFYGIALIGLLVENNNLLYAFYAAVGLLYVLLLKVESPIYTAQFLSVKDLLMVKFKNILYNNIVLYLPLWLICSIYNFQLSGFLLLIAALIVLLGYATQLLTYAFGDILISGILLGGILLPLFVASLIYPPLALLFAVIIVLLSFKVKDRLNSIFNYAENQ
ncbi:hypothetical protein AGMMS49965_04450 [Bacteroidia bacterium]|nr:hypothetical protein AGMMS49965_04450 [Bacteroidia bacterium]